MWPPCGLVVVAGRLGSGCEEGSSCIVPKAATFGMRWAASEARRGADPACFLCPGLLLKGTIKLVEWRAGEAQRRLGRP